MSKLTVTKNGDVGKGSDSGIDLAILKTIIQVANQAKRLAPVGLGQLRNSIMWKTDDEDGGLNDGDGEQALTPLSVSPREHEGYVGANLLHAIYQEFGTRNMSAQPYLRIAIDIVINNASYDTAIAKVVAEEMQKEMSKGVRKIIIK